jgi:hypothetical protein
MNKSVLLCLVPAMLSANAWATHEDRVVIVNGRHLDGAQIAWLDQRNCAPVPNGRYWLDLRTGAWGYAGWPQVQGYVGAACGDARPQHRSLSERGLLYRPGEILNGR